MTPQKEQPKIFDDLDNYLVADAMLGKTPSDKNLEFYQQIVKAKAQLDARIDAALHEIADNVKL